MARALVQTKPFGEVDITLHGLCEGHFVIDTDGVTLRGADSASGLAAPDGDTTRLPVLEVIDAQTTLRGIVVRGGEVGVHARGWDAEVLIVGADVHGQSGAGVLASRGASITLIDTTVHDGNLGIGAQVDGNVNLQNVTVSDERIGVGISENSFAALNGATITGNREAGLSVDNRSDANVIGGVFRDNGGVHINASDGGNVTLLSEVTLGSNTDSTPYALGATRAARIASFSTPFIHGNVSVLDGASLRLGNTQIDGSLSVMLFSNAHVRDSTITGIVFCLDGADAICSQTTTAGVSGCPSSTCGSTLSAPQVGTPEIPKPPVIEVPRLALRRR